MVYIFHHQIITKLLYCNIKDNAGGDIIMNKYSENNEIIKNEKSEEKTYEYIKNKFNGSKSITKT